LAEALSGFGQITAGAAPGEAGKPAEILFPPALPADHSGLVVVAAVPP
jgi:hypothetical protein